MPVAEILDLRRACAPHGGSVAGEDARDVREVNQRLAAGSPGAGRGHLVGVDVVKMKVGSQGKAGHHRDEILTQEQVEEALVHAHGPAYKTESVTGAGGFREPE